MVRQARALQPAIPFETGDMLSLSAVADEAFGGIAAFYSIVHIPADRLAEAFAEHLHERVRKEYWGYASGEALTNAQLIELEKSKRGSISYGTTGTGTSTHLLIEMLNLALKTEFVHIPYKSPEQAQMAVISGEVDVSFTNTRMTLEQMKAGRIKVLAMTGSKRSATMPEIATVAESGYPGFEVDSWYGVLVPAGTSRPGIDLLHREIVAATRSPEITDRLVAEAIIPVANTPEEFRKHIQLEHARMTKVVKASAARID